MNIIKRLLNVTLNELVLFACFMAWAGMLTVVTLIEFSK